MRRSRSIAIWVLAAALLLSADDRLAALEPSSSSLLPRSTPAVTLRSASGATIQFRTQNGETVDSALPQIADIPHLVLFRDGTLTDPGERTLTVEVAGIPVPPSGLMVTLDITTHHTDADHGDTHGAPILVWRETRHIGSTRGSGETEPVVVFTRTFSETVAFDGRKVPTPTDYFRYRVSIGGPETVGDGPSLVLEGDFAFLMERQWIAPLPTVREESVGAAPEELIVYFCDMFPFQGIESDVRTRLARSAVPHFVRGDLVPGMIDAFRIQSDVWGFLWYDAWTSFRLGEDPQRLSVALTDGQTWYHGAAPSGGRASISLNTNADDNRAPFDTLSNDLLSTFHHELFHNLQRSLNQHLGGDGRVGGADDAWVFFSEGTAYLASSVGLPRAYFNPTSSRQPRMSNAGASLAPDTAGSDAMVITGPMMYWRFLYEQCGGLSGSVEDPGAGMAVIRNALTTLYSGQVADIAHSRDLLGNLAQIMDNAIAHTSSCPFRTYEQSLAHFARTLYSLHLDGGRCAAPGIPAGCGFYDPHSLYRVPQVTPLAYEGGGREHRAFSWTSLDVDLYEVMLQPGTNGQPLQLELEPNPRGDASFIVQVWKLFDGHSDSGARPIPEQAAGPEVLGTIGPGGRIAYDVPAIDVADFNRIGLLITRADPHESSDSVGQYTIRLTAR